MNNEKDSRSDNESSQNSVINLILQILIFLNRSINKETMSEEEPNRILIKHL